MKNIQSKYFSEVTLKKIFQDIKTILTNADGYNTVFWNSELFNLYSRTKRQINKLPLQLQDILKRYGILKLRLTDTPIHSEDYMKNNTEKALLKVLDQMIDGIEPEKSLVDSSVTNEKEFNLIMRPFNFNTDIVDLYFIARSLRPAFGLDLAVGYFGDAHNTRMIDFLTKQGLYQTVFYYGPHKKYLIDENFEKLDIFDRFKIVKKTVGIFNDKCVPLT
jgi:hypothetical protein